MKTNKQNNHNNTLFPWLRYALNPITRYANYEKKKRLFPVHNTVIPSQATLFLKEPLVLDAGFFSRYTHYKRYVDLRYLVADQPAQFAIIYAF